MEAEKLDEKVIWKDVVGFEEFYQVSNTGEVRSKDRKVPSRNPHKFSTRKGRILRQMTQRHGYKKVSLTRSVTEKFNVNVHRAVAEAFIPNPDNKPYVNHMDCDKGNNHVDNLEWVTAQENTRHAIDNNLIPPPWNKGITYTLSEIRNK